MRDLFGKRVTWRMDAGSVQEMGELVGGREIRA